LVIVRTAKMNSIKLFTSSLVLVMLFSVGSAQKVDYSPCTFGNVSQVVCISHPASKVLEAFRRNEKFADTKQIYLLNIVDMTDANLEEILNIAAKTSGDKIEILSFYGLNLVTKVPAALQKFTALDVLYMWEMGGIETVPAGAFNLKSENLHSIKFNINSNLKSIAPGAFKGNLDDVVIILDHNGLTKFDEAVFKPLLSENPTLIVEIFENPIQCDCSLAWMFKDSGKLLDRIRGNCIGKEGKRSRFSAVGANLLESC